MVPVNPDGRSRFASLRTAIVLVGLPFSAASLGSACLSGECARASRAELGATTGSGSGSGDECSGDGTGSGTVTTDAGQGGTGQGGKGQGGTAGSGGA